ncbi:helix-turn-helix domain-containing protein [Streptomyces sp. NPDC018000]|uniref:helix-turn-helix domain-containing protein n=1 Tax=Streptomyces sp. NPDC018000 TaxID=3365028 RepID=UPI0037B7CE06
MDVICVVLDCEIGDLLIPEPQTVTRPGEEDVTQTAVGDAAPVPAVVPKRRGGRSLPPE